MTRIGFLLFEGFSNMVLSCLLEPLRAVRDQAGIDIRWQVLTPTGGPVRSSSGLSVVPDVPDAGMFDLLVGTSKNCPDVVTEVRSYRCLTGGV